MGRTHNRRQLPQKLPQLHDAYISPYSCVPHTEEIKKNMRTYLDQVDKILLKDPKVFSWIMNSDWFVSINDIIAPEGQVININVGDKTVAKTPPLPANHILAKAHREMLALKGAANV